MEIKLTDTHAAPEQILASNSRLRGYSFTALGPQPHFEGVEYVRRDPAVLAALPEVQAQIDEAVLAEREWWITSLAPIKHQVEFYTRRTDLFRKGDQP
jgi:hypothetical protein